MRPIHTLFLLLPFTLTAQTTWWVEVGGSLSPGSDTLPYYEPDTFAIALGDIVHFHCVSGTHNVYGELDEFSGNPVGFSSDPDPQDAVWDYFHTFDVGGVYEFMCTQNNHSNTQMGMITVGPTSIEENTASGFALYPVPSRDLLTIELEAGSTGWQLCAMDGKVLRRGDGDGNPTVVVGTRSLAPGQYVVRCFNARGIPSVRAFVKE